MNLQSPIKLVSAILTAGLALSTVSSHALVISPGTGSLALPVVGAPFGGAQLATTTQVITTPTFNGTARGAVFDGPEAGVNLDFYYQFTVNPNSPDGIGRLTAADFATGFTTDVYQTPAAFSVFLSGVESADTTDRGPLGVVGFGFLPGSASGTIDPAETSYTMIIRTNAVSYTNGFLGIIDGTATFSNSFQPALAAVPEPGSLALLATGLFALGGLARKRSRTESLEEC